MALILKDRVLETSTTTGTGTFTLLGAVGGYQSFAAIGNSNTTYYTINNTAASEWEAGLGTYTSSGTTLARTTVLSSSNAGSLVNFSAGTKNVWCDYPAEKSVNLDASGNIQVPAQLLLNGIISPTQLTADQDNYAPTNITTSMTLFQDVSDTWSIGGLTTGDIGRFINVFNIGASRLLLNNEASTSTAANRFYLGEDQLVLAPNVGVDLVYNTTLSRWLAIGGELKIGKGFFSGGTTGSAVATADRTTYSTETTAAVVGANLSVARYDFGVAGNAAKGFFSGGTTGSVVATADRTTYSTETTDAVVGANLSVARFGSGATGNAAKGFFSGGFTTVAVATADRTTYSTETTAAVVGANLSVARYDFGAAGNAAKGFFSGGFTTVAVATADRTTYSTETTAAVVGANLSVARYGLGAAGNAAKGFFSGGTTGSVVATADRTTYSTETTAAVVGANLSVARRYIGATGNAAKGFFSGGTTGSAVATADRTTYSTETTAAVVGANLSVARYALGATGTGLF